MKKLQAYIVISFLALIYSCHEQNISQDKSSTRNSNRTIDLQKFSFTVPGKWNCIQQRAGDTIKALLVDGKDTIHITYGSEKHLVDNREGFLALHNISIEGLSGSFSIPEKKGDGFIKMYIEDVERNANFYAEATHDQGINNVLKILCKVDFTSKNGNSIELNEADFRNPNLLSREGSQIFKKHCATCHNPVKDATGPPLRNAMAIRSKEWLYNFLTDTNFDPKDSISKSLKKQYGLSCMKFPHLGRSDVYNMYYYSQDDRPIP